MSDIPAIALSGMRAAVLTRTVDASNIANVHSDGFTPSRAQQSRQPGGGTGVRIEPAPALPGELTAPLIDQIGAHHAFEASALVLRSSLDIRGRLLDVRA